MGQSPIQLRAAKSASEVLADRGDERSVSQPRPRRAADLEARSTLERWTGGVAELVGDLARGEPVVVEPSVTVLRNV